MASFPAFLFVFLFGLTIGSFLNVVIFRLHRGESIVKRRSHCVRCGHVLAWYELVPVVSFVLQKGKCRACGNAISWQYPFVELATGILFLLIFNFKFLIFNEFSIFEFLNTIYYLVITSLLTVIFVFDLKHYIIPDKIIYPATFLAFINHVVEFLSLNHWDFIQNSKFKIQNLEALIGPLSAAILVAALFAAIFFISKGRWLGFGDVKLAFFMGLFLGWPNILIGLFFAWTLGGIIGIALLAAGKKTMKSKVPFGPFLVAGSLIGFFGGSRIWEWYTSFLL